MAAGLSVTLDGDVAVARLALCPPSARAHVVGRILRRALCSGSTPASTIFWRTPASLMAATRRRARVIYLAALAGATRPLPRPRLASRAARTRRACGEIRQRGEALGRRHGERADLTALDLRRTRRRSRGTSPGSVRRAGPGSPAPRLIRHVPSFTPVRSHVKAPSPGDAGCPDRATRSSARPASPLRARPVPRRCSPGRTDSRRAAAQSARSARSARALQRDRQGSFLYSAGLTRECRRVMPRRIAWCRPARGSHDRLGADDLAAAPGRLSAATGWPRLAG